MTMAEAPRGEMVDIGGRRLRVVREGSPGAGQLQAGPLVVMEHGAFGCAADWAEVQSRLAAQGVRSLAYDRAGLGYSDPGPEPRDGQAIAGDLARLLKVLNEAGPLVLVGHSMGGLMVRIFAQANPARVAGVVLVDAVVPEVMELKSGARGVAAFGRMMVWIRRAAKLGLMRPASLLTGNLIELTGEPAREKRRIYAMPSHAHWATEEVLNWPKASAQAAAGAFAPALPIAVVTAGVAHPGNAHLKALQVAAAKASSAGYVVHVARANHASLLGRRFAQHVAAGVSHVLAQSGSRAG